jgi:CNT family concentrative nucleoside transporter
MLRLVSALGIVVFILIACYFSKSKRKIPWRIVVVALILQFAFAAVVTKTVPGEWVFSRLNTGLARVTGYSEQGASFVFGNLSGHNVPVGQLREGAGPEEGPIVPDGITFAWTGAILAFKAMPIVIFFGALSALLYHLGVLQRIVGCLAFVMEKTLKVSGAESLSAAANVFLGHVEAPLVVRPYLANMTRSELMSVMVGGMATIAGSVFVVYVSMLNSMIPEIGGLLLAASVISAPGAIMFAKIFEPETEVPQTLGDTGLQIAGERDANVFAAITRGASDGMKMALIIISILIVFVALVAMLNDIWGGCCYYLTSATGVELAAVDSLPKALSYIFAPFAFLMGIETKDCLPAGQLLAERMCLNEFIAYQDFANHLNGLELSTGEAPHKFSERSQTIMSYALCGFANFGSIGVIVAGLGAIIPERKDDLAKLGLRAMFAATLATMTTGCIAGILL